jgi:NAD(P)H-hydrate epimerase
MLAFERSGGGSLLEAPDPATWQAQRHRLEAADVVVDAVLGTGLRQEPTGLVAEALSAVMAARAHRRVPIVAVDLPSGMSADAGDVAWPTLEADLTVTFGALKYAHVLPSACDRLGEVEVADIGIPFSLLAQARLWLLEEADARAAWPRRPPDAHKGRFGHVLVVAGSVGKSGAATLCGSAALLSGAGLVTVACPAPVRPEVAASRAELMTEPLPASAAGGLDASALEPALAMAASREAVAVGPGLGTGEGTRAFVRAFVEGCRAPLVVDADGLNALAPGIDGGALAALRRPGPTVITPHPGEAARLLGTSSGDVQARRVEAARELSARTGAVVVLKGHRTLVADPDGNTAVNPTGNAGMASGGTGDVLAGVIACGLARGLDAWRAATAAVYVHGKAGDVAARRRGQEALTAGDLLRLLPVALRGLEAGHR